MAWIAALVLIAPGLGLWSHPSRAEGPASLGKSVPVQLIAIPRDIPLRIARPPKRSTGGTEAAMTATFTVTYVPAGTDDGSGQGTTCKAWPAAAQTALEYAASIWGDIITSTVPINVQACWATLGSPTTLGYSWSSLRTDGSTVYHQSLYEKIAGTNLSNPDTFVTYNDGFSWYFGTDGATPAGQYDFVSVVLHEIGHSLNFAGGMRYGNTSCGNPNYGCWGYSQTPPLPNIYDRFTEDGSGQSLIDTAVYANFSTALGDALRGGNLYFDGPKARFANGGTPVKIYAPGTWASGSSYSHLDYATYAGGANALMVYAIGSATAIHSPGPVARGILEDVGWTGALPVALESFSVE